MSTGTVTVRLRPIKFAFIVDYKKNNDLLDVIKANTFLWAGQHNAVIPFFKRIPNVLKDTLKGITTEEFIENYIETFDPDIIVNVNQVDLKKINFRGRKVINFKEILDGLERTALPKYGIGLFEILEQYVTDEFKFVPKYPPKITIPEFDSSAELLLSAIFGVMPDKVEKSFWTSFSKLLDAKKEVVSTSNFGKFLTRSDLFLRRLSFLYIKNDFKINREESQCILFVDSKNALDVITYWNLRALGWRIIPIPKQSYRSQETKELIVKFIEEHYEVFSANPNVFRTAKVIKAPGVEKHEFDTFIKYLKEIVNPSLNLSSPKFLVQALIPRMWLKWSHTSDFIHNIDLMADEKRTELTVQKERIEVEVLAPKFFNYDFPRSGEYYFVNEINYNLYSSSALNAEVIPQGIKNHLFSYTSFRDEWRISKNGVLYLANNYERNVGFLIPKADEIMISWFKQSGFIAEKSYAGRLTEQMYFQLEGKYGVMLTIGREGIVDLLDQFKNNIHLKASEVLGKLKKIIQIQKLFFKASDLMQQLTDKKIFELGFEIQCPICTQRNWYALNSLAEELRCYKCLSTFTTPVHSPSEIVTAYKSKGPFGLPNRSYGAYSVLLSHNFFTLHAHYPTTSLFSFNIKGIEIKNSIEVDLGLFFQENRFGVSETYLVLAECKTNNDFEANDFKKMKILNGLFPGSILLFATLKNHLNDKEKKGIRTLIDSINRKSKKITKNGNVLILTKTELVAYHQPPYCWSNEIRGRYEGISSVNNNIIGLCNATQEIYLK
ncbi:hypothetical protein [Aurantibacillus circumpalustris]|uniref:hypothetical protein n=1 Tax=Aurantibacillus circumpalustris TaxID=3036359 RepID=UPI00295C14AE|nr:hypothetical protein [Aurantibacillus circumpalustris]